MTDQGRRVLRVSSDWGSKSGQRLGGKVIWQEVRDDGNDVVFGGSDRPFRRESTMVLGGGAYWKTREIERK